MGGIDIVVSNAAGLAFGPFSEVPAEDFDRTVAVTFGGPVDLIRAALPHLRESHGTIVATGSLNARLPLPFSAYAASNHALRGFLNTLRIEEREQGSGGFGPARPVVEAVLLLIDRWYRTGTEPAPDRGSLYAPMDHPAISGGMPGRDSLLAWTRLGRRMAPSPVTPFKVAGNLAAAALQGAQLIPQLFGGPVPEKHLPVPGHEAPAIPARRSRARRRPGPRPSCSAAAPAPRADTYLFEPRAPHG